MSNVKIEEMNQSLYYASLHVLEAGKYMSNVDEFKPYANKLFLLSDQLAAIIQPEIQKISDEKVKSILDEILSKGD